MNKQQQGAATRDCIFYFIIHYIEKHGYAPTIREIGDGVNLSSSSSVQYHLKRMFMDGTLETDVYGSSRAIRVPGYRLMKV